MGHNDFKVMKKIDNTFQNFMDMHGYDFFNPNVHNREFTYNDVIETVESLKKVKDSGLVNMLSIPNVAQVLSGFGCKTAEKLIASVIDGSISTKYYELLLNMMDGKTDL